VNRNYLGLLALFIIFSSILGYIIMASWGLGRLSRVSVRELKIMQCRPDCYLHSRGRLEKLPDQCIGFCAKKCCK